MNISSPDYKPDPIMIVARRIDAKPETRTFSKWMVLHLLHHCVRLEVRNRDLTRQLQRLEAQIWLRNNK